MTKTHALIVGSGIVGLAIAYHLVQEGIRPTLIDRDPAGDKASFGNAGGISVAEVVPAGVPGVFRRIPGWLLDPLGPLSVRPAHALSLLPWLWAFAKSARPAEASRIGDALAALSRRAFADLEPMLAATGLAGELHRSGALTVYETEAGFRRDAAEWETKRVLGFESIVMDGNAARALEPALGPLVTRAVLNPDCARVSDPKALTDGLRRWLVEQAGVTLLQQEVTGVTASGRRPSVTLADGTVREADALVIAAGAWSAPLAAGAGDRVLLESERGYNTTLPQPGVTLGREIVFAERKFVAMPLRTGLRIGGAAEFGGLAAKPNYRRSQMLLLLAARYLPGLDPAGGSAWAGHRPSTPDSLPVIGASPHAPSLFYAFGHGHLGLTYAATTGRLIADAIIGRPPQLDLAPYSIARFA